MNKTNTCAVRKNAEGEEDREKKTFCNARSSGYSFPKLSVLLQMLTPDISVATANSKVFHISITS